MYKTEFLRLSMIHTVSTTDEVAECGLHIADPTAIIYNAATILSLWTTANLHSIMTSWHTMLGTGSWAWADYSHIMAVKLAPVGTDGKYTAAPLIYENPTTLELGTASNVAPQDTIVMSLRTGSTFGTANYGRMYVPHTRTALEGNLPSMTAATALNLVTSFQVFIAAVNTIAATHADGDTVCNMSQKGTGTTKKVTQLACGDLIDTQRRRRNRIVENYQTIGA